MTTTERVALWFAVGAGLLNAVALLTWLAWIVAIAAVVLGLCWLYEEIL